ncbi:MAG: hypothetical protein H6767_09400 [Candidatus Peribacteria bacterium]|nr:MAG: hypothetical protein H6767_09400 [Candidatus Peribacteria bacterium]
MNKEIIIVDTEDNVIGLTMRGEPLNGKLFRVSALWLMDIKGNILLSKRSVSKKHHP